MARAQSCHSVWDESIESHAGRESGTCLIFRRSAVAAIKASTNPNAHRRIGEESRQTLGSLPPPERFYRPLGKSLPFAIRNCDSGRLPSTLRFKSPYLSKSLHPSQSTLLRESERHSLLDRTSTSLPGAVGPKRDVPMECGLAASQSTLGPKCRAPEY
jgi:hypothetical protein